MRTPQFDAAVIRDLLKTQKIATLEDMKTALGTRAPATVFRKLSELKHHTSYSHGARYYTLAQIARFDASGLWSYDSVWFSSHGTLLATLLSVVNDADAGLYAAELEERLHVKVSMSLLKLFNQGSLSREKVHGLYLYCSADKAMGEQQIEQREAQAAQQGTRAIVMGKDWVSDEIKAAIVLFFSLLDEQQRRLFAGLESLQFGHGGDSSIARLLGLDPHTVAKGRRQIIERDFQPEKLRKPGAGRPGVKNSPEIVRQIERLLEHDTAGDPMSGLKWSRRTTQKVAEQLALLDIHVSAKTVCRLLKSMGYSLRTNRKSISHTESPQRNEQFEYISHLRELYASKGQPIISVDTKKKELVGQFKNAGRSWELEPVDVNDHDFRSQAIGMAVPYGIYELLLNRGTVYVGTNKDTSELATDAIAKWWRTASSDYTGKHRLLILADGGGSNSARGRAWKAFVQTQLADRFGLEVTVCHYPPGTSKWNPIEHRLFSEISKNWSGKPLDSYDTILNYIRTTRTASGLKVRAKLLKKVYKNGITITKEVFAGLSLERHETLPQWNYTLKPRQNA